MAGAEDEEQDEARGTPEEGTGAAGATSHWAICPLGDMFNHAADALTTCRYDPASASYRYVAGAAVPAGEEVFVCYGGHDDGAHRAAVGRCSLPCAACLCPLPAVAMRRGRLPHSVPGLCVPPRPLCAASASVCRLGLCVPPRPLCAASVSMCRLGLCVPPRPLWAHLLLYLLLMAPSCSPSLVATLLEQYGFVLPCNPHARLQLGEAACELPEEAAGWLTEQGLGGDHHLTSEGGSWELVAALRLKHATEEERAYGGSYALLEGE